MERREALKYTTLFMGIGLSASSVSAILSGCEIDQSENWVPAFFSKEEAEFIREVGETMLPRTHTPGAKDAKVDRYLDTIRLLRYTAEDNLKYKEQLAEIIKESSISLEKEFTKANPAKRLEWLTSVDKAAYETVKNNPEMPAEERPFYLTLKEHILSGYFNSEIVAKEYFAFDPIPGRYDACIPYEDIGKAWAI